MSRRTAYSPRASRCRLACAVLVWMVAAPAAAWASMAGGFAGAPPLAPALPATFSHGTRVADVIVGTGKPGPYVLTWTAIERGSERVTVNGVLALAALDYQVDYGAGKLTFMQPLRVTDMALVEYAFQRGAKANAQAPAAPVSIPLATLAGTDLSMTYAYKRGPGGPGQETMVLGLTGERETGADGRVTGRVLFTDSGAPDQTPAADRTAYQLTATERAGSIGLSAQYARAGERFAGGKELGLKAGVETWNIGAGYDQGPISGSTKYLTERELDGGGSSATWQHSLGYAAPGLPTVAIARTDKSVFDSSGRLESRQIADQLSLRQAFGPTQLLMEHKALAVTPAGEPQRQLIGDRVAIEHRLTSDTKVTVARQQTLARLPGDKVERTTADSVGMSTRLYQFISAEAAHEQKTLPDGGLVRTDTLGLTAAPAGWVKFKLAHLQADGSTQDSAKSSASVQLAPRDWASINAGFERAVEGSYRRTVSRLHGMLKPTSFLTMSGGYVDREDGTPAGSLDTTRASVAVALAPRFRLTGEYTENPEDDKGRLAPGEAASVGVASALGCVGVKGSYGRRIDAVGAEMRDSQIDMSVAFAPSTKVYTGYRLSESLRPALASDQETYRVGFSHAIGGDFSLSLEGQRILYHENERYVSARSETRAEARLSMRWR